MCQSLCTLCQRLADRQALSVLNPYFSDVVLYLQAQVKDPFAEVKMEALRQIAFLASQLEYENGESVPLLALISPFPSPLPQECVTSLSHCADLSYLTFAIVTPRSDQPRWTPTVPVSTSPIEPREKALGPKLSSS
jgi:hypothetical protein